MDISHLPVMGMGLTRRQLEAARVIQEFIALADRAPTYAEIAVELEIAHKSGAHWLVHQLADRGFLVKRKHRTATIRLLHRAPVPADLAEAYSPAERALLGLGDPAIAVAETVIQ